MAVIEYLISHRETSVIDGLEVLLDDCVDDISGEEGEGEVRNSYGF